MKRFDYVPYDETGRHKSQVLKDAYELLEELIHRTIPKESREKSLALTKLEESFMWVGKTIRNDVVDRAQLELGI